MDIEKDVNDFNEELAEALRIPKLAEIFLGGLKSDNVPKSLEEAPKKNDNSEGKNPQLFLKEQVKNMTDRCRIYTNVKTFEYDLALEKEGGENPKNIGGQSKRAGKPGDG